MTMSYTCSYVHYRKLRRSLQGPVGSCISRDGTFGAVVWKGSVGVHDCGGTQKKWRAARVMALESGAAPSAPMWHPAPRAAAACSSRLWRLLPVTQPQAGPVSPSSCGRRAASRAHGQPPGAGLGRRPEARGTAGCGEALAGMPQEKGLYISYTLSAHEHVAHFIDRQAVPGFPRLRGGIQNSVFNGERTCDGDKRVHASGIRR